MDVRYGAGRDLLRATKSEADEILDSTKSVERPDLSEEQAAEQVYWRSLVLVDEDGDTKPLSAPTVEQLGRHRDRFMPSVTHLRADHRTAVSAVADLYGLDLGETKSKDALIRAAGRKKVLTSA